MNQLPNTAAWNTSDLMEFPVGYRPAVNFRGLLLSDGENDDWTKNYHIDSRNNKLRLSTRSNAYVANGLYANGHGYWFTTTYITTDDYPV